MPLFGRKKGGEEKKKKVREDEQIPMFNYFVELTNLTCITTSVMCVIFQEPKNQKVDVEKIYHKDGR